MTRGYLLAISALIACAVKPNLFEPDPDGETDTDSDTDADTDDGADLEIDWSQQLAGLGLDVDVDEDGRVVVYQIDYDAFATGFARFGADGAALGTKHAGALVRDFAFGDALVQISDVEQGGYTLEQRDAESFEKRWSYGPVHLDGWSSDVDVAADGSIRVAGTDTVDGGSVAYLDIVSALGELGVTWSEPHEDSIESVTVLDTHADGATDLWLSTRDQATDERTVVLVRVDAAGATASSRTVELGSDYAAAPVRTASGWIMGGSGVFGAWTQTIASDLSTVGPRVIDATAPDGVIEHAIGLDDGVLLVIPGQQDHWNVQLRRYDVDGSLIAVTTLPSFTGEEIFGQRVFDGLRVGDDIYLVGSEVISTAGPSVPFNETNLCWVRRLSL